jgi:hypothetical protein
MNAIKSDVLIAYPHIKVLTAYNRHRPQRDLSVVHRIYEQLALGIGISATSLAPVEEAGGHGWSGRELSHGGPDDSG